MPPRKKPLGPLRCAPYLRCSTDDQKHGDFTTIDTQRNINAQHIASIGGVLVGEFVDEGKTGTNLNRPDWKRLLAEARAGNIDAVVVSYMSRLARGEPYYVAEYLLKEAKVQIIMVKEQFTDDLAGYANKTMTVFLDGMYPKQVSEWTRTKQEEMVRLGYRCGGLLPYGYASVFVSDPVFTKPGKEPPKRLVVDEAQAPFVHRAFELFAEHDSYERVRQYLLGVTDRDWTLNNVIYMLKNEVYIGVLAFGKWRNEAAHEAIIERPLWEAVCTRIQTRIRSPKHEQPDRLAYYLRSMVFCTHCGCRMTPASHHGRLGVVKYYECLVNTKRRNDCPVKRVNAHTLHVAVLDQIERAANHPTRMNELIREAIKAMPSQVNLSDEVAAVSKRLKAVEKQTKGILAAIEAGGGGIKSLTSRLKELQEQEATLTSQKYQAEATMAESRLERPDTAKVQGIWKRFLEVWQTATEEERNELLPLLVERVDLTEKERGTCRLMFLPANPRLLYEPIPDRFVTNPNLGAGSSVNSNLSIGVYPPLRDLIPLHR